MPGGLGSFLLFFQQNLSGSATGSAPVVTPGGILVNSYLPYSAEARVRFPLSTDSSLTPTELSGAILTLSSGSLASSYVSLWYEKPSAASSTGNLYVTSSNGRLQITSASIFDDNFYNLAVVKDSQTGSLSLYVSRYENDELVYSTSSVVLSGAVGYPLNSDYSTLELGSSTRVPSKGQFWAQEVRFWTSSMTQVELGAHSDHFENYGRDVSFNNADLKIHWRLNDGGLTDSGGNIYLTDSTLYGSIGTGSAFTANSVPFTKFLLDYAYLPSVDYGWNQQKVRVFSGSYVDPFEAYHDERYASLEFNMYDALNEDISQIMSSYDELQNFLGLPVNRYRADYEGLQQMRETYFKRLQGPLSLRTFVDMLDFFDSSFVSTIEKLLPARSQFNGDEVIVESHMLERPKYQYQLRPVVEGRIDISGSISVTDYGSDFD